MLYLFGKNGLKMIEMRTGKNIASDISSAVKKEEGVWYREKRNYVSEDVLDIVIDLKQYTYCYNIWMTVLAVFINTEYQEVT